MCLQIFFLKKKKNKNKKGCWKQRAYSVLHRVGCKRCAFFVPRAQGNATQGRCALPSLPQARCSQTLYHSRKLLNLVDNLKRACNKWHLENKIQSKSNQIMKQDVIHSTDNKIGLFVKWETGLLLLLGKTENLPIQLMVMQRRTTAISVTRF